MMPDYIDFISAYCDRWCERCAFTSRCSAFAAEAAIAMCGDEVEGLELAVGVPHPEGPEAAALEPPAWLAELVNIEVSPEERVESTRRDAERRERLQDTSIMKAAWACSMLSHRWFTDRCTSVAAGADDVLKEALAIAMHDVFLIAAKLNRALDGRDRHQREGDGDDHPIQNDWNGSAKVALISIERSEAAWRVIAQATGDETPGILAEQLQALRREVEREFPKAWSFIRPGFDETGC